MATGKAVSALSAEEQRKYSEWLVAHYPNCPSYKAEGVIGGKLTFNTASGIGVSVKMTCTCGDTIDLTDYASW